jgi:hypothetical protein
VKASLEDRPGATSSAATAARFQGQLSSAAVAILVAASVISPAELVSRFQGKQGHQGSFLMRL